MKGEIKKENILEEIIKLIYPPVCAFCGKIDKNYLCENCRKNLQKLEKVHIYRYKNKFFNEHIYMFKYEKYIREKILNYKFNDKPFYYKTFTKIFITNKKMCDILKSYDIIIPVPIHNKRRKQRGYNQTELIAKELAKEILNLEYMNILTKNENAKPQSLLNKEQRIENAKNVYGVIKNIDIENKRILIFDDIYTTGATANECAKELKKLKPKKIGILTIAKD